MKFHDIQKKTFVFKPSQPRCSNNALKQMLCVYVFCLSSQNTCVFAFAVRWTQFSHGGPLLCKAIQCALTYCFLALVVHSAGMPPTQLLSDKTSKSSTDSNSNDIYWAGEATKI